MKKIIRVGGWFFISVMMVLVFFNQSIAAVHHPQAFLDKIAGTKDEGAQLVLHYCANCHAERPIIPLGAPRIGLSADWEPRIKQGVRALLQHVYEGMNAMPARGGCFECTDEQLLLAVMAMLPPTNKDAFLNGTETAKSAKRKK